MAFLIHEYQLVKAGKHPRFRFAQDFYSFHGTSRQTFAKLQPVTPSSPVSRVEVPRTLPYIEQKVINERLNGTNSKPSTILPRFQLTKDAAIEAPKTGRGWATSTDYLSRDTIVGTKHRYYLVGLIDAFTRLAWGTLKSINFLNVEYGIQFEAILTDNGPEMAHRGSPYGTHALGIKHRYTRDQREDGHLTGWASRS